MKPERDAFSGHKTTGHEWNGIKELNTPVPRVVYFFLVVTIAFLVFWTILMPSWPYVTGYFGGILGVDQRSSVEEQLREAALKRADWSDRIASSSYAEILADPELMHAVNDTANELFVDNCAACHGATAAGGPGFPNLAEAAMLWGSAPETIEQTITYGINDPDEQSRFAEMPAFGSSGILSYAEIGDVVSYVRSLSGIATADEASIDAGKTLFADNCAACHGEDGHGSTDVGSANLADEFWIYGSSREDIRQTVTTGRAGHMPAWRDRLSPLQIKMLTAYLVEMRGEGE